MHTKLILPSTKQKKKKNTTDQGFSIPFHFSSVFTVKLLFKCRSYVDKGDYYENLQIVFLS